jgi:hypothetical protein
MDTPRYARLVDGTFRGRLADLRNAVRPVLAGNYLPSFTDHSVEHSDRLCELIDQLTEPLGQGHQLNDREAFVLYSAAYLHDAGLQHQRAEETIIVQSILRRPEYRGRAWADLDIETRRGIVRAQHHRISGEMITQACGGPASAARWSTLRRASSFTKCPSRSSSSIASPFALVSPVVCAPA